MNRNFMPEPGTPLLELLPELLGRSPLSSPGGFRLILTLSTCAKRIAAEIRALGGRTRMAKPVGSRNVSGDLQKPLDLFAHELLTHTLLKSGEAAGVGSEESPELLKGEGGEFVVLLDPLDGSSNIEVQVPTGTIFSIYPRSAFAGRLPRGREQIAAGYVLYSSATVLVFTAGAGVYSFLLDPASGEFYLEEELRMKPQGEIYSINEANAASWQPHKVRTFIERLKGKENPAGKPYTLRYVGTLVADAHRTLKKGGVFLYPGDKKNPKGKLRLLYEAFPMGFLFEQAGGVATEGTRPILEVTPEELHEKTPLFLGSTAEMELYNQLT